MSGYYHSTFMRLFRRSLDLSQTSVRFSHEGDLNRVVRLFRDGAHRYYGLTGGDLPGLLTSTHAIVLESGSSLWGVALFGWYVGQTTWLRGVAFTEGVDVTAGMDLLLPPLHEELVTRGLRHVFYAGDEITELWLNTQLRGRGYLPNTEVIVYEKRTMDWPSAGNQDVQVRTAQLSDEEVVVSLDQACFEAQWTKDDLVLRAAIEQGPLCVVADLDGQSVGYAYATTHFGERLTHLVRIAVTPAAQGQGIGVRLLAEVIKFAQQRQSAVITLNTQSYNIQSQRLYRWFGFEKTGERQIVLCYDL